MSTDFQPKMLHRRFKRLPEKQLSRNLQKLTKPISKINKPRTAKVGAISKAQNCKRGDSLGFVKLQLVAKYEKK